MSQTDLRTTVQTFPYHLFRLNKYILPMTPSCWGDNILSGAVPGNEPDASDILSDIATTDPPGDIERAETLDPAKEVASE